MDDLRSNWPSDQEKDEEKRFIHGKLVYDNKNAMFIRKEQIPMENGDQWATRATQYWNFEKNTWIIDNTLQQKLDEEFFEVYEDVDAFYKELKDQQSRHDMKKNDDSRDHIRYD